MARPSQTSFLALSTEQAHAGRSAFFPAGFDAAPVVAAIRAAWGDSAFVIETTLR